MVNDFYVIAISNNLKLYILEMATLEETLLPIAHSFCALILQNENSIKIISSGDSGRYGSIIVYDFDKKKSLISFILKVNIFKIYNFLTKIH